MGVFIFGLQIGAGIVAGAAAVYLLLVLIAAFAWALLDGTD